MNGESELSLSQKYLGVVMQSNWSKLPERKKPPHVRLKNFFLTFIMQINQGLRRIRKNQ